MNGILQLAMKQQWKWKRWAVRFFHCSSSKLIILSIAFCVLLSLSGFSQQLPTLATVELPTMEVLDLEAAQRVALSEKPSLQAALSRVRQAQEAVKQIHANWYPRLDLEASASRIWLSDNEARSTLEQVQIFDPNAGIDDPEDYYSSSLQATWLLFDGFARRFSEAAAKYGVEQSQAAYLESRRLLLAAVAETFYNAQLAREGIAIAKSDEAFNRRLLEEARARRERGTGSLSDELNFEVRVNGAKTQLILAEADYEIALVALAELMAIPGGEFPEETRLAELEKEVYEELLLPEKDILIDYAMENRPDLTLAYASIEQAQAELKATSADYYPSLNAFASVEGARANSARFQQDDYGQSVGLSLNFNLFSGGARQARLRAAKERVKETQQSLDDLRLAVASEVRQAIARLDAAQQQVELQRSNVELVRRTRDLVEKEYKAGQTSLVRLNEAQRDLTTAQGNLAQALVGLRRSWHNLATVTGQVLVPFGTEIGM